MSRLNGVLILAAFLACAHTDLISQTQKDKSRKTSETRTRSTPTKKGTAPRAKKQTASSRKVSTSARKSKKTPTAAKKKTSAHSLSKIAAKPAVKKGTTATKGRPKTGLTTSTSSAGKPERALQKKAELKVPGKTPIPEAGGKAGVMGTSDSKTTRPAKDLSDPVVGKTREGKPVFEGTQMGFYYLNDDGKRVYVNEFEGVKIVGKTSDGKNIYEGLRGGHFYFNDDGNKVYVKR